jgi:hypothetical protein
VSLFGLEDYCRGTPAVQRSALSSFYAFRGYTPPRSTLNVTNLVLKLFVRHWHRSEGDERYSELSHSSLNEW